FHALVDVAPDLRHAVATYAPPSGPVVRGRVLHVAAGALRRHYSLDVIRIDRDTYMAALADVTEAVDNETLAREALQLTAVQEGRFEVLTSVLHDIGNGITGLGTRTAMLAAGPAWEEVEQLDRLAQFVRQQRAALEPALGADRSGALVSFVDAVTARLRERMTQWRETLSFFVASIAHVQEIMNIQRQFIRGGEARRPLAVTELLDDALALQRAVLQKRGVVVSLDVPPRVPRIEADRTRMMQVFVNVLKNVVEAFDAVEPASAATRTLQLSVRTVADDHLEIAFTDNACGFAAPNGEFPIARGATSKPGGSGLGLYASAQIVASHHGSLTLRSPGPGLGATCIVTLPLRQPPEPAPP
ncbi:MAG TPA: ATP-binding protein, partial [Nannocystis sp.]